MASIFINPILFSLKQVQDTSNPIDDKDVEDNYDTTNFPRLSIFGEDPWWDDSFEYRVLINVTNPYSYDIQDYGVSVSFDYDELVQNGKMQPDLDDIRIIENGYLRNYYVVKDFPSVNFAKVYFDTSVSQNSIETDTYMYFGNDLAVNYEANQPSESFGWVKNGDFELNVNSSDNFEPFGWYFSHNPVNEIMGVANPNPAEYASSNTSIQLFVNKLIDTPTGGERVAQGNYAYKWGTLNPTCSGGVVNDYAGTFFTYPFTVPNVDGGVSLLFYRNIRTYRFEEPKNPPGPGAIDIDGYFIRILNGSNGVYDTNPDNHDDDDIDPVYGNYAEAYDGHAWYNPSSKKWTDDTLLKDFSVHTIINDTKADSSSDGDFTGYSEIDLTPYMGKEVFFEIGVWGDESNAERKKKDAFFQVDDLKFNYTLSASLNEVQARKSDVTIIARDIDGRIVPNAEIAILNESAKGTPDYIVDSGFTSDLNGSITFTNVLNGEYNITANYTMDSREVFVGNKMQWLNGTTYFVELSLNLWTIDFEIVDWDGIPLNYGYIEINETYGGPLLDLLTLNNEGKATFRWLSASEYYFRVYYQNEDYSNSPFLLNESYISRQNYDNEKIKSQTLYVNNTNRALPGELHYLVQERVYTNGSRAEFGNKKIIRANLTLSNMDTQLTNVSVYYIDKNNSTGTGDENLIYFEDGYGFSEESDYIEIDIPLTENAKLESENYDVYGLFVVINGDNSSQCNGDIQLDFLETCNAYNQTHLSRLNIRVININELSPEGTPVDALVKVFDNQTGESITNLISDSGRDGYAYSQTNDIPFWFFKDRVYNFSINVVNITNAEFNVTLLSPENQWKPIDNIGIPFYNYTLYGAASITFNIIFSQDINITSYDTAFFNSSGSLDVYWGEELTYSVIFEYTLDNGNTWDAITNPSASCTLYVREVGSETNLKTATMGPGSGPGNFTLTFNSNELSAGGTYKLYYVFIEGLYPGYPEPNPVNFLIKVKSIPTKISAHDYETRVEITDRSFSVNYNELLNISMKFYIEETGSSLEEATLAYSWIGLDPININKDALDNSYFTFTINTSDALSTGLKLISITASFENYSTLTNFLIYVSILERATNINGQSDLIYLTPKVNISDTQNFVFSYTDANTYEILGDLTVATYIWQELYENGTAISGRDGSGTLIQNMNNTHTLNFNTELKQVGFYYLYVTLYKDNYETKSALVNLEIILREFDVDVDIENLSGNQVNVVQGNDVNLEIILIDLSRGSTPLENASINLNIGGNEYLFNETSPGRYTMVFETEVIDAFFAPNLLAGIINIIIENFTSQQVGININVQMEEIFPGVAAFYFILIVAAIVGVVGSLVTYRVVQQARIPKFVKKVRKVKGSIKSNKGITESHVTKTKDQMMLKLYGDDWKELELSLETTLGIVDLKLKPTQLKAKKSKKGGDRD